jgi:protoheme IX farnesyltransferase
VAVLSPAHRRPAGPLVGAYVALTKPRIIELLLVTTVPPMILAAALRDGGHGALPSPWLVIATLIGGTLAAASANTINCYVDRDIDALMHRTSKRPLVRKAQTVIVSPIEALRFGIVLTVLATAWLAYFVNTPAALLADAATAFYVFVYTMGLKRRTPSNIVIGGAAGCFPVLVGWAAVTGGVGWPAVVLFAVIFLWTPPHFWALAFRFRNDYEAASVPMLPVVASAPVVAKQIVLYTWAMVATSLLLFPVAHLSVVFLAVAMALGAEFIREAYGLRGRVARGEDPKPMRLFHWSITYLSLLCIAASLDVLVRSWL